MRKRYTTHGPATAKVVKMVHKATVRVVDEFPRLSTRPEGIVAREFLIERLHDSDEVEVDFLGAVMTPSFAEEFIGKLATRLGHSEFARRVRLINASAQLASLLRFVIAHQKRNGTPP